VIAPRRVGTGVVVGAAVLGVFALDWIVGTHWGTAALVIGVGCGALWELLGMVERAGLPCHKRWATGALAFALFVRAGAPGLRLGAHEGREVSLAILLLAFLGPLLLDVVKADREVEPDLEPIRRSGVTAIALAYVGLLTSFVLELRMLGSSRHPTTTGLEMLLLLCACVKVGDSVAYFVGRSIGRTPLCPVSPKKTWEGSVGSLLGSVATSVVVGSVFFGYDVRTMAGFGVVVDLAGQGGDLVESYVKRLLGAKDSSSRFGEMGGFLDVADALLLAAPPAYLWAELLIVRGG
jgi:phosphatidate cytidylyltransferase